MFEQEINFARQNRWDYRKLLGIRRIIVGCYQKGSDAACGHGPKPKNPYSNVRFRAIWEAGYDDTHEAIETELVKLKNFNESRA